MSKLRVSSFSISIDGYGAGPDQGIQNPLGVGGEELHEWLVATRTFNRLTGKETGSTGPDDELAARGFADVVTGGIHEALERARDAAGGKDVRLGGGAATIRQYLHAGLVDELHLAVSPILLGSGEHLLADIDLPRLGYRCAEHVPTPAATHYVMTRSS